MIEIYKNGMKNIYRDIPKKIKKAYVSLEDELLSLESKAASSSLYRFISWEDALKNEMANKNPIYFMRKNFFINKNIDFSKRLGFFLKNITGKLLWSSGYVQENKRVIIKAGFLSERHYQTLTTFGLEKKYEYISGNKKFVRSAILEYLSPRSSSKEVILAAIALQTDMHSMNCEQFVLFTLISINKILPHQAQIALFASTINNDLSNLYNFLGADIAEKKSIQDLDLIKKLEPSIVFERKKRQGEPVSHLAIYYNSEIYELCFGKNEEEFSIMKTDVELYLDSAESRSKNLFFAKIKDIPFEEKADKLGEDISNSLEGSEKLSFFSKNIHFLSNKDGINVPDKNIANTLSNHLKF